MISWAVLMSLCSWYTPHWCYACRLLMEQQMSDTSSFFCKLVLLWILWKHSHRCALYHDAVVMVVETFINVHTQETESRDLFHTIPIVCVLRVRVPSPFSWKPFISSLVFPRFKKRSSSDLHTVSLDRKLKRSLSTIVSSANFIMTLVE